MHALKKSVMTGAVVAVLIGGALIATGTAARANVACNGDGECWNTHPYGATVYPPDLHVQVYNDDWRKEHLKDNHYHWMKDRDNDHGYYSHGEWHTFEK